MNWRLWHKRLLVITIITSTTCEAVDVPRNTRRGVKSTDTNGSPSNNAINEKLKNIVDEAGSSDRKGKGFEKDRVVDTPVRVRSRLTLGGNQRKSTASLTADPRTTKDSQNFGVRTKNLNFHMLPDSTPIDHAQSNLAGRRGMYNGREFIVPDRRPKQPAQILPQVNKGKRNEAARSKQSILSKFLGWFKRTPKTRRSIAPPGTSRLPGQETIYFDQATPAQHKQIREERERFQNNPDVRASIAALDAKKASKNKDRSSEPSQ